jgi:hypothetical protein
VARGSKIKRLACTPNNGDIKYVDDIKVLRDATILLAMTMQANGESAAAAGASPAHPPSVRKT